MTNAQPPLLPAPKPGTTKPAEAAFAPSSPSELQRIAQIVSKETIGGALLIVAAVIAIVLANSPLSGWYEGLRDTNAGVRFGDWTFEMTVGHWAADGLLAVFFFMAGLELKREFIEGDLRKPSRAIVPIAAAAGGVIVPALIYLFFAGNDPRLAHGWAIPTATDIAFAVAVLAVVGSKLPLALRTFLLTLAVVDDLIAIVIIAIAYTSSVSFGHLFAALIPLAGYWLLAHHGRNLFRHDKGAAWFLLLPLGILVWALFYLSGIHATIAGVLLGFSVPVRPGKGETGDELSLAETFEHRFRPLSAGICVPLFAFFSAGVSFEGMNFAAFTSPVVLGIALGLILGKPIGITLAVFLTTRVRRINLDPAIKWLDVIALAMLAGIGFTVSLLISELAFPIGVPEHELSKSAILIASTIAAIAGGTFLWFRGRAHERMDAEQAKSDAAAAEKAAHDQLASQ